MKEWSNQRHHKAWSTEDGKVQRLTWLQLLRHLARSPLHHSTFRILETVFFHPIFPNRPLELCSQHSGSVLLQDVRDLTIVDVIKGCALVISAQTDDHWSTEPVAMVIKDNHYLELDLLSLTGLPKLFPGGTAAVVFSKVAEEQMLPGVYVHEVRRDVDVEKDDVRCEGAAAKFNEEALKTYSWRLIKVLENQLQAKLLHFTALYKLTITEQPYIAYVLKCSAQPGLFRKATRPKVCPRYQPQHLSALMTTTSLWKEHKPVKLHTSLRSFVVNTQEDVIIEPSSLPPVPSVPKLIVTAANSVSVQQITKTKENTGQVRHHRTVLPLLKRELEPRKSIELQGQAYPWRYSRLDRTIA